MSADLRLAGVAVGCWLSALTALYLSRPTMIIGSNREDIIQDGGARALASSLKLVAGSIPSAAMPRLRNAPTNKPSLLPTSTTGPESPFRRAAIAPAYSSK